MTPTRRDEPPHPTADLIERFDITLPDGTVWEGSLHRTAHRTSGRRILVRDAAGAVLHDTGDCYDYGNATNGLELWLADRIAWRAADVKAAAKAAEEQELIEAAEREMDPARHSDSGDVG